MITPRALRNLLFALILLTGFQPALSATIVLRQSWQIQDSNLVKATPSVVSQPGFATLGWISTSVPSTVLGAIVDQTKLGYEPFVSKNILRLPGSGPAYDYQHNFMLFATPKDSPFSRPWYYRTEFSLHKDRFADLQLKGATYGAEIWLNGVRISDAAQTAGTYRQPTFDITATAREGVNALVIMVGTPKPDDLTASWVDWAPTPQDKNMGLWQDVVVRTHGAVSIANPQVITHLNSAGAAALTIEAEVTNNSRAVITGVLHASLTDQRDGEIEQTVTLEPLEKRTVQFLPSNYIELVINHPKLWWPAQMGTPALHTLKMSFDQNEAVSDQASLTYGIREITSTLNAAGSRLFSINRKPILIRGGGWASDLYLRYSHQRAEQELQYVRDLGLNTIRLEGRFEQDDFLQLTDKYGILVMTGWVCCSAWQDSAKWTATTEAIARASVHDQALAFRAHASTLAFLYGSDEAPAQAIENAYLSELAAVHWANPILASAADTSSLVGRSGFKMNGPYDYVPPSYWSIDKDKEGGAWGFNTETSPGASIPPLESLKQFIPVDHLWPIDDEWIFHAGELDFHNLTNFVIGLNKRYGEARSVEEFAEKSQVMGYDNHRAMFEAFNKNKYRPATGIIQWMLNNPWPSLIWHLYDYYLRPGGTYFGAKEANRPLHIQYSYDDQTIYLINQTPEAVSGLLATVEAYDVRLNPLFARALTVSSAADSSALVLTLPALASSSKTYFVRLVLRDSTGTDIDHNFYWLSTQKEVFDWEHSNYYTTPLLQEGDLQDLASLPRAHVEMTSQIDSAAHHATVTLHNTSTALAFFVHARLAQGASEVLPVLWSDNYVSLMPGESRVIEASFSAASVSHREPYSITIDGWNR